MFGPPDFVFGPTFWRAGVLRSSVEPWTMYAVIIETAGNMCIFFLYGKITKWSLKHIAKIQPLNTYGATYDLDQLHFRLELFQLGLLASSLLVQSASFALDLFLLLSGSVFQFLFDVVACLFLDWRITQIVLAFFICFIWKAEYYFSLGCGAFSMFEIESKEF